MRKSIPVQSSQVAQRAPTKRIFARASGRAEAKIPPADHVITIYDEIGPFGISATAFHEKLKAVNGDVTVRINSPGGDAFDGIAMHNDLIAFPGNVRIEVVGVAASAASIVAMAGNTIATAANAHLMIHRAFAATIGNYADHEQTARVLESVDQSLARTYADRTGRDVKSMLKLMTDETWMLGQAAIDEGFADELLPAAEPSARFDLSPYAKVPDGLKEWRTGEHFDRSEIVEILRNGGVSVRAARKIVGGGFSSLEGHDSEISDLAQLLTSATSELRTARGVK